MDLIFWIGNSGAIQIASVTITETSEAQTAGTLTGSKARVMQFPGTSHKALVPGYSIEPL